MSTINENKLKINGVACIDEPLKTGTDYQFNFRACCDGFKEKDNDDGTVNHTFSVKINSEVAITDGQKIIIGEKKKSPSQKLRGRLYIYSSENGIDKDLYYDKSIAKLINYWDEIAEILKSKT